MTAHKKGARIRTAAVKPHTWWSPNHLLYHDQEHEQAAQTLVDEHDALRLHAQLVPASGQPPEGDETQQEGQAQHHPTSAPLWA